MNEYYVFSDGKELGPFLISDLKGQQLSPDTLMRNAEGGGGWKPAGQIDELKPLLQTSEALKPREVLPAWLSARRIGIIILLLFAVGAVLFFLMRKGKEVAIMHHKEHIRVIHDREVQKAIQELNAEKQSKKREAERKELFRQRKAELRGLDAQLEAVTVRKANALAELDEM